ncbi:MAG TPA: CxxC-x17-CxxC domain-containing protein [Chloroflexota bacterium]
MFTDRDLTCRDCGQTFVFTSGEQEFFSSRGLQNDPSRCPTCRAARNASGGGSYGAGGGFGGGYDRGPRQMFAAVCADCGKDTQVPFQPRNDRPVYCSDCFERHRPARSDNRGGGRY